jgi:hypothetical protein
MKMLILLLMALGFASAADCEGPCGCDPVAGYTELNISVYDSFGPIPPSSEGRLIWIEYEKEGKIVRETLWDGWIGPNTSKEFYQYKVPSCAGDPVSRDYYIYLYSANSSCRPQYDELMGENGLVAGAFEWNGTVYSDECVSGYQFKLIRSYFESSVPLYLYPDRYSKYSRGSDVCLPAMGLAALLSVAALSKPAKD